MIGIFGFNLEVKMCFNSFVRCFIYVEVVVEVQVIRSDCVESLFFCDKKCMKKIVVQKIKMEVIIGERLFLLFL